MPGWPPDDGVAVMGEFGVAAAFAGLALATALQKEDV
jgi:hypothetical protein